MGSTTRFIGKLRVTPALSLRTIRSLEKFCSIRHDDYEKKGMPGIWCDWQFSPDYIFWNGHEKSYDMVEWMEFLIKNFLCPEGMGYTVNGRLLAIPDSHARTLWMLNVKDNVVEKEDHIDVYDKLGITGYPDERAAHPHLVPLP